MANSFTNDYLSARKKRMGAAYAAPQTDKEEAKKVKATSNSGASAFTKDYIQSRVNSAPPVLSARDRAKMDMQAANRAAQRNATATTTTTKPATMTTRSKEEIERELEIARDAHEKASTEYVRNVNMLLVKDSRDQIDELMRAMNEARTAVELLEKELKYTTSTHDDNFFGQFGANYDAGRLAQDTNAAYNAYLANPTEENKARADALAMLEQQFQTNNAKALDDENAKATWITKSAAGYLPQLIDQTLATVGGGAAGALGGAGVGSVIPVVGTGTGAVWGARAGAVAASGAYSYGQMRGAAYRELINAGVDEETARAAANDEAVISALIEMADTGFDMATLGTGKLISLLGKGGVKAATKGAASSASKKLLKGLAGYGLNIAGEAAEEGLQQSVSIANQDRDGTGIWNLAGESASTLWDAASGANDEARDEILEAAGEGAKIAAMFGGATRTATGIANTALEARTGRQMQSMGGDETVQAMIETGLESDKNTESYQLAVQMKAKLDSGKTLSNIEIGRLQQANVKAIEAEAPQSASDGLMDLARETVAERENAAQPQADAAVEGNPGSNVPYNVLSMENPVRKARDNAIKNTGYGENGIKAFTAELDRSGESVDQVRAKFQTAYELGRFDTPREKVSLETELQQIAYNAGRLDYIADMGKQVNTSTAGAKSGFDTTGAPSFVTSTQARIVDDLAKALGSSVVIGKSKGNAEINSRGAVVIADDFQTKVGGQDVSIVYHAAHEIGMHRLMQLAPTEGRAFLNAMYNYMSEGRPQTAATLIEEKQSAYAEQDVTLTTDKAAEEVVANNILSLYENEEAFGEAVRRIANGNDQQAKRGLEKFREILDDIVKKLRGVIAKLTGKEKAEAKHALGEVEHLREMYENALAAAVKKNRELTAEKNATQESDAEYVTTADGLKYSLKMGFEDQVDAALTYELEKDAAVYVMDTPEMLQALGLKEYPVLMTQKHIRDAVHEKSPTNKRYHGLTVDMVKRLPELLENPVMMLRSLTDEDSVVIVTAERDSDNLPVIIAVKPNGVGRYNRVDVVTNFAVSMYGRSNFGSFIDRTIKADGVLYVNKKRTRSLFARSGLKMPQALNKDGFFSDSIAQQEDVVNGETQYSLKDSTGRTLSPGQQEYFKDSKVRDENGNLKVVYHGSPADFNTFSLDYLGTNGTAEGYGFYFTDKRSIAEGYSSGREGQQTGQKGKLFEVYLDIKKPLSDTKVTIPRAKFRKFLTELNKLTDEDGEPLEFLSNYGDVSWEGLNAVLDAAMEAEYDGSDNDVSMISSIINGFGQMERVYDVLRKVAGYDGIIVDKASWGGDQSIYITFRSEQAKNVDNLNPTDDPDIRFSLKDSDYLAAVQNGDMETAQRMVNEAAEKAGYTTDMSWRMMHSAPNAKDDVSLADLKASGLVPDDYWDHPEWYTSGAEEREAFYKVKSAIERQEKYNAEGKGREARVWVYRAVDKTLNSKEESFRNGDWVTPSYDYAVNEGRMNPNGYRIIKASASVKELFWDGNSIAELGYDDGNTYAYADTKNNRKLLDPVTYDEYGQVIPLSKRFNRRKDDTSFSLKEQNDLLKENAKLKEVNEGLREQFKTTTFAKVDKKSLDKFTKQLLKDYQSGADINEIRDALNDVYTYMANGEDGQSPAWNDLQERAYNVAVSILENASTVNDEMYQAYKSLRDRLRNYPISIDKAYNNDIQGYESINDFRKANFGRLKISNDGTPVDIVYSDLANTYPEFFDETEYTTQADQLTHIADVLDSLQPYEVNPYSSDMRRAATWLASDIIERFYELPQAKPTFADKQAAKLTKQVIKDAKKLENLREKKNERIKDLIVKNREKVKATTQKEREKRVAAVKEIKDHYKAKERKASESRKARELRAKIMRHAQEMSKKLLRPTDKQHIPQELRGTVVELLESINMESQYTIDPETGKRLSNGEGNPTKRSEKFTELQTMLKKIKDRGGEGMVFDPSLLGAPEDGIPSKFDDVIAMKDTPLHAMNTTQLTTIWEVLRAVEFAITNAGKTLSKSKYSTTVDWATAFEEDTASRRVKRSTKEHYTLDIETPYTFFSHYGQAGMDLYRMLRNAQDHQQLMQDELADKIGKLVSLERHNKLEKESTTFTTDRGEKLVLSKAHVMEMYLLSKRQQAYNHLIHGGIVQPEVGKTRRGTSVTLLTETDVAKITSSLTAEERALADKYQDLTNLLAKWGNEASMKAYGYEKFSDPNYWPIRSASEHVQHTVEKNATNRSRSIANMGSAKPLTPEATNTLDLPGIFTTFDNHAADMMDYAAWLLPMEDVNRLFNFNFRNDEGRTVKTMQDLLNDFGGTKSDQYWMNLMTDIQNGVNFPADTAFEGLVSKVVGNTKRAAVAANLRVVIQQPTALARASAVLDPDLMLLNIGKGVTIKSMMDGWEKAKKYAPIAARKAAGGFEIASNPKRLSEIFYKPETAAGKFVAGAKEAGLFLPGVMDAATWGVLWNTSESQIKRDNKDLRPGTDEFYAAVEELFTEVIDQTQVVDGVLQRSQAMRSSSSLMKQMTSFTGEPTQAGNMIIRAYDKVRYETDAKKRGKAIKVLSRAVAAYMVTAAINAFAQSIVDALRDDDDEKDFWEKVWKAWSGISGDEKTWLDFARNILLAGNAVNNLNPLTWVPVMKDVLSLIQGYSVQRMDVSAMEDLINSFVMTIKTITGDGKQTTGYAALKTILFGWKLAGGGGYNFLRDLEGIVRTVQVETNDYMALYETEKLMTKPKNNVKVYTDMLYLAYAEDKEQFDQLYARMLKDDELKTEDKTTAEVIAGKLLGKVADDLYELYKNDPDAYEEMYDDLIERDFLKTGVKTGDPETDTFKSTADHIATAMESRMKKEQGVDKVKDLESRYFGPEQQREYDSKLREIQSSGVWKNANAEQRDKLEDNLRRVVLESDEDMMETIEEGAAYGLDDTEYLLYKLALETVDQPNENGEYGTYSNAEKAAAISSLDVGDGETAFLWNTDQALEAFGYGIGMDKYVTFKTEVSNIKADKDRRGKTIAGSRKKKIIAYLNSLGVSYKEYLYLLGTEYDLSKDKDYRKYFGE